MNDLSDLTLKEFQADFVLSEARYPALVAGIGTGKTMMLLLKIVEFCKAYPQSLALVVRKEYTDLHDSTIKDFERYFKVGIDSQKEYHFKNGSVIMFRHGAELNVLRNINLSIFGMEQAEEFETDEQFQMLRDRLRRDNAPYRQGCIISNAHGHNWIWKLWINNPPSDEYDRTQATTFDNEDNLPKDFIDDLRRMKVESPNHYRQYVLNCHEEVGDDDLLFTYESLDKSTDLIYPESRSLVPKRILSVDVARFGEDATCFTILEQKSSFEWEQILCECHKQKDLMWTVGRFVDLKREFHCDAGIVDDDGMGGGVSDRLKEMSLKVEMFRGGEKPKNEEFYFNRRAEEYFNLKEMIDKGYLKILNNPKLIDELMTIRFKYNSKGQRQIVSKDDMRKEGLKSPDMADSLVMATSMTKKRIVKRRFDPESPKAY